MKSFLTFFFTIIITVSTFSESTYTWVGNINSSFSTAANWSPVRTVGLTTDKLIFETGTNVNVLNANQVTIGQFIIRNNTGLTLSPATGNSKTIFIGGGNGDDFVIENGSTLIISGNDPQLNIQVKAGATANISGQIIFSGEINHTFNSIDSLAIRFKQGSVLKQLCPGSIFTTSGIKNSVVFENGSELMINHPNAQNPFALSAPDSKVKFETGSSFVLANNNPAILSLGGRHYSNLIIDNNINTVISENIGLPVSIENFTINSDASFSIKNLNPYNLSEINITGDLVINGFLNLSDTSSGIKNLDLNFNGSGEQSISGSGTTSFTGINRTIFRNSISLGRNLVIESALINYGRISRNSFNITVNGKFVDLSPFAGVIEKSGNVTGLTDKNDLNNTPHSYSISQNYPNPFNPNTKIDYTIAAASNVTIKVFDITGKEVVTLINGFQNTGNYTVSFNASSLSSGIYFCKIITENDGNKWSDVKKMILAK